MTGPGVNLTSTLDGGDASSEVDTITLQAGGTYTMEDATNVAASKITFAVSSTGSAQAVTTPSTSSTGSSGSTTTTSPAGTKKTPSTSAAKLLGTLIGGVSATGKVTLTKSGKTPVSLTSGRYSISVSDRSKKAGFSIQSNGKTTAITSATFVGAHKVVVDLSPGRWTFFSPGGKKTTFLVLS
jgi:hypothetical protein